MLLSIMMIFSSLGSTLIEVAEANGSNDHEHYIATEYCDDCAGGVDCADCEDCANSVDCAECDDCDHHEHVVSSSGSSSSTGYTVTMQAACTHSYALKTVKSATCTQAGEQAYVCTKCGARQPGAPGYTIKALGHNYQQVTTKQATCGTAGAYETKCTRCGVGNPNGNGAIPATGKHTWKLTGTTNATCTADGKKTYKCSVCSQTKTEKIAKLGHNMVQVTTKEPTCGTNGTYETKCSRCGTGSSNGNGAIPATGKHTYNVSAATCTTAKKCTVCGYVAAAALGHNWNVSAATCTTDKKCTRCGTVGAKATGHTYNVTAATCTTAKKCTKCGTVAQAALGHNWDRSAATCTADKKCTRCGTVGAKATGHTYNVTASTCTTAKTCTTCGYVAEKATGHSYNISAATCTTAKKCTKCGTVAQAALGHNMVQVTTKEPTCGTNGTYVTKCSRCGAASSNGNGAIPATGKHTYNISAATCTTAKKCTVCGYVAQAALGHNWDRSAATCTADKKCTRCGTVGEKATGHTYNVSAATCTTARKCTKCGTVAQAALGHNMVQVTTKEPTCGTNGTYETKCSRCGAASSNGNGAIPATGKHTYNVSAATCTTAKKCTVCGYVAQAALGHNMVQVTTKEPTCGANGTYETKCSRCGAASSNGNGAIPATGKHTYNISEATCTTAKKCTVCGYVAQTALGHNWNRSAATCTADKKCTRCGTVGEKATGHTYNVTAATCTTAKKCTKCGTVAQAALGHNMVQVTTKEPTCGTNGTYETKCSRCGAASPNGNGAIPATGKHTYNVSAATCTTARKCKDCGYVVQAALGHNMVQVTTKEPTCGTNGTYETRCSRCGAASPNGNGAIPATGKHTYNVTAANCTAAKKCTVCGYVAQAAFGHDYQQVVTKEPTCGENGTYETKCSRCGAGSPNGNGFIPATGKHSYNVASATCTTAKKCKICGHVAQAALGHDYQQVVTKEPTCGENGTYESICSRCGAGSPNGNGFIPATGKHTYNVSSANCVTARKCTECGYVAQNALGHDWNTNEATCTTDKKCKRCGTVEEKATGHSFNVDAATCTVAKKCKNCGLIEQKALGHDYHQVVTKKPTCGKDGTYETKCLRCGAGSPNGNGFIPATGEHTYNVTEATCTTAKECTTCGHVEQKALGHDCEWIVTDEPSCLGAGKAISVCKICGTVVSGTYIEYYGDHRWGERNAETCTKECTLCGYIEESHDYRREERTGDKVCMTETVRVCNDCQKTEVIKSVHTKEVHEFEISRTDGTYCSNAQVWRICPYCGEEVLDEIEKGTEHQFDAEGVCILCHYKPESEDGDGGEEEGSKQKTSFPCKVLLLSGEGDSSLDTQRLGGHREKLENYLNGTYGYDSLDPNKRAEGIEKIDSIDYTYDPEETLKLLDDAQLFVYTGHGNYQDTSLLLKYDVSYTINENDIKDKDLTNLIVACLVDCFSAGRCSEPENVNTGITLPDKDGFNYYLADSAYKSSLAYKFCEQGAYLSIGCNTAMYGSTCDAWTELFVREFLHRLPALLEEYEDYDWSDKECLIDGRYNLAKRLYIEAAAAARTVINMESKIENADKDLWYNTFMFFRRKRISRDEFIIEVTTLHEALDRIDNPNNNEWD